MTIVRTRRRFQVGGWRVDVDSGLLTKGDASVRICPKLINLLLALAEKPGELLSKDVLIARVWPDVVVGDASFSVLVALAALGRVDEINEVLAALQLEPDKMTSDWQEMLVTANELRAHGFPDEARDLANRVLQLLEGPDSTFSNRECCVPYILKGARRFEDARREFELLVARTPENRGRLTALGVCAAHLGDRVTALEMEVRLEQLGDPIGPAGITYGLHGSTLYRCASIAATLGDRDRALQLLRRAVLAGYNDFVEMHRNPDLEPLWHDPEFQEILRPKD